MQPALGRSRSRPEKRSGSPGCVLVTGASAGLGSELARAFASRNYDLVLLARRREKLDELARELTVEHHVRTRVLTADLSLPETPRRVFEALRKAKVRIDVLVNNAEIICEGDFLALPLDDQIRLVQTNVVALTALTHLFAQPMKEHGSGRILNVASIAAFMPAPTIAVYAAAKSYVLSFSEAISEELSGAGVTVTALCPGITDTPMLSNSATGVTLPRAIIMSAAAVADRVAWCASRAGRSASRPDQRRHDLRRAIAAADPRARNRRLCP